MLWDSVLWDFVLWDFVLWDFVLWDFVLWDFVLWDFVLWDFVLWDSVRIPFVHAITDSANKYRVFGGHFNPKSLSARTLGCDRQFSRISMLPSGDRKQYFISRVNACVMSVMNHVIVALWLHSFYDITS